MGKAAKQVRLDHIKVVQMRAGTRLETVEEYSDLFRQSVDIWPFDTNCKVYQDGDTYWLWDGVHRHESAKAVDRDAVMCDIAPGTFEDAQDAALGANKRHGLRRTREDVRNAIRVALTMERWLRKSNRVIAEHIGTTDKTVALVRGEMETTAEIPQLKSVVGKDGKSRKRKQSARKSDSTNPRESQPRPTTTDHSTTNPRAPEDLRREAPADKEWRKQRSKAVKTADALQRAIDDLQDLKRKPAKHKEAITKTQQVLKILESWS